MGLFGKKKDGAAVQVKKLGFEVNSNGKAIRVSRIISTRNDAFFSLSDPCCSASVAIATCLSCGLGGMELEGDQYNVRFLRVDLYTGLRCCFCRDCSAEKAEKSRMKSCCCYPLSMCLYCGTICCFCDTYPRYAKLIHEIFGVRFPGHPGTRQNFCAKCFHESCPLCPVPLLKCLTCAVFCDCAEHYCLGINTENEFMNEIGTTR